MVQVCITQHVQVGWCACKYQELYEVPKYGCAWCSSEKHKTFRHPSCVMNQPRGRTKQGRPDARRRRRWTKQGEEESDREEDDAGRGNTPQRRRRQPRSREESDDEDEGDNRTPHQDVAQDDGNSQGRGNGERRRNRPTIQQDSDEEDDVDQGAHGDDGGSKSGEACECLYTTPTPLTPSLMSQPSAGSNSLLRVPLKSTTSTEKKRKRYEERVVEDKRVLIESFVKHTLFKKLKFVQKAMMDDPNGKLGTMVKESLNWRDDGRWPHYWDLMKDKVKDIIAKKRSNIAGEMKREFLRKCKRISLSAKFKEISVVQGHSYECFSFLLVHREVGC